MRVKVWLLSAVLASGCALSPLHLINRPAIEKALPANVKLSDYVERGAFGKITVGEKLARIGAHVKDGKLYDMGGRPIEFFKHYDGGMQPPEGWLERMDAELEKLKKTHTVIEIYRDPDLPPPC
jgi:hypothetical protein